MVERARGTRDLDPKYLGRHRHVEGAFRRTASSFGFREVLPPTIEPLELFHKKAGPGIEDEMYAFQDKGGRDVVLRPEFTAGVLRYYVNELRAAPKPIKVYSVGPCFRYEEPQMGRYREFWQYSCEVLGGAPLDADAEVVALAARSIRAAGVRQVETRVGHVGMLRAYIKVEREAQDRILHALDRRNLERLHAELDAAGRLDLEGTLRDLIALRGDAGVLAEASDLLGGVGTEGFDHLRALAERLRAYGAGDVVFDMGIIRGLAYYTGMVFQIHSPNLGAEDQVGGGGSYALAELFGGEPIFSTGFAIGMDRVVLASEAEGVAVPPTTLDAYVVPIGDAVRGKAFEIATALRETGLAVDIDLVGRGPSKNLDHANAIGARWVVLVGAKELAADAVGLRNMETGEQRDVPIGEVASVLGMDKPRFAQGVEFT